MVMQSRIYLMFIHRYCPYDDLINVRHLKRRVSNEYSKKYIFSGSAFKALR